jgi:hypothetical protein
MMFTVCGGRGNFRIRLTAPTKIVKKWGIGTHRGTHKVYFIVQYKSEGPENTRISCVTPFGVMTVI